VSDRFSRDAFEKADPTLRLELCRQLAESLGHRLAATADFHGACYDLIADLRRQGHDLWSMDESDDFQEWGPNYQEGVNRGLYLRFAEGEPVTVIWLD
jgi:hypothetical protein